MKQKTLSSAIKSLAFSLLLKIPKAAFLYVPFLTFAAFFGGAYWLLELTTHFRLQYFVLSCFFLLLFLALKLWRWAGVALICLVINSFYVVPWYLPSKPVQAIGSGQKLRLLLSNVLWENKNRAAVVETARREQPDVAFFQEVTYQWANELEALRPEFPHYRLVPAEEAGGMAMFSRIRVVKAEVAPLADYNGPALIVQINVGNQLVSIVSVHTPPPGGKENFDHRTEIFNQATEYLNSLPDPKILIGDLNTTMWSPYYKRFVEKIGLRNVREGFGILPSWPTFLPPMGIPIDQCLVSREVRVVSVRTGNRVGSDHLPLIVDLVIPQQ
ncbi:MAG: endonuclease/exonuclease/phosphatase family protein [Acidobacteria bacterium]|nr:endonuclease/exonuclease/phosphatase family protein [Acidobacteriota bacterium]